MNKIILLGWLFKDPELRISESGEREYTRFTIGVDRNYKSSDGTRRADFITIVAYGKKAEVMCKYLKKGDRLSVSGRLRTGSYEDKDGNKKYVVDVVAEDFRFINNRQHDSIDKDEVI